MNSNPNRSPNRAAGPIGALTNRLAGRSRRPSSNRSPYNAYGSLSSTRASAKPGSEKELFQQKVDLLLSSPAAFAEFKKCVVETNNFSNTGALNLLYVFLEGFDLPELQANVDNGPFGFGLLNSIRTTMAGDNSATVSPVRESPSSPTKSSSTRGTSASPQTTPPSSTRRYSDYHHDGTVNISSNSPTKSVSTTPTFASSSDDSLTSTPRTQRQSSPLEEEYASVSPEDIFLKQMERKLRPSMPACLEQPSLMDNTTTTSSSSISSKDACDDIDKDEESTMNCNALVQSSQLTAESS